MTGGQAECTRFRLGSWLVPARQQEQSTGSALVRPLALALLTSVYTVTTLSGTGSARAVLAEWARRTQPLSGLANAARLGMRRLRRLWKLRLWLVSVGTAA